ncbi:MAG: phosphatase PAP2 family protein [Candidatus Binataceae bacterium]
MAVAFLGSISLFYGITGRSRRLADTAHYAALWLAFSAVGVVFTYLMADLRMPLWDARFARMDAALGFDWPAWLSLIAAHRPLKYLLEVAYSSLLPQIIFSIIYLSHIERPELNHELLFAAFVSLVITSVLSGLLPALGAKVYFRGLHPGYLPDLLALRSGTASRFVLPKMQGIVTMPSFHAALAILFIYAHRPPARSCIPIALLNILMLLSLPSAGGHYLVDMIAGAAIAALSIAIVRVAKDRIGVPTPVRHSIERLTSDTPRTRSLR